MNKPKKLFSGQAMEYPFCILTIRIEPKHGKKATIEALLLYERAVDKRQIPAIS